MIRFVSIACSLFLLCILLSSPSFGVAGDETWTYLFYIAGDEEEIDRFSRVPIRKLEQVGSQPGRRILVQADFHLDENGKSRVSEPAVRYEIEKFPGKIDPKNYETLKIRSKVLWRSQGETHSSSKKALSEFISWGVKYAPADHYALFLLSHAWGWRGMGDDHNPGFSIPANLTGPRIPYLKASIAEFSSALTSGLPKRRKLDLLVMDVCNEGVLEFIYEIRNNVQYLVASPTEMPFMSFDYAKSLSRRTHSVEDLSKSLVSDLIQSFARGGSLVEDEGDHPAVAALALNIERFSGFWPLWKDLVLNLDKKAFRRIFLGDKGGWTDSDQNADLIEMLTVLSKSEASSQQAAAILKFLGPKSHPIDLSPIRLKTAGEARLRIRIQGDELPSEETSLENAKQQFEYLNPWLDNTVWKVRSSPKFRSFEISVPVRGNRISVRPYLAGTSFGSIAILKENKVMDTVSFRHKDTFFMKEDFLNSSPFLAVGHTFGAGRYRGISLFLESVVDPKKPENYHWQNGKWIGSGDYFRSLSFAKESFWSSLLLQ